MSTESEKIIPSKPTKKPKSAKSNLRVAVLKRNLHKTFCQHHPDQYQQFLTTQRTKQLNRKKMIIAAVRKEIEANKNLIDQSPKQSNSRIPRLRLFPRFDDSMLDTTAKQLPCYRYLMILIGRKIMKMRKK